MSISAIDICNAALLRLGQEPITSFEDGTRLADNIKLQWPVVRDRVLRSHDWPSAVKRVDLTPMEPKTAVWDKWYRYNLPADYLRMLEIKPENVQFRVEGMNILADTSEGISIRYIYRNEETGSYDAGLVDALVTAMVKAVSFGLTQSLSLAQLSTAEFQQGLQEARAVTITERDQIDSDEYYDWLTSRF